MSLLERNPDRAAQQSFDLIVVGGGIQGACLALEASRRGLRALLLEREDFGGATSWNSLRIIHGGLRHLQRLEFGQFTRSAIEQAWWLRNFPDLVRPLPCLMPLYNDGLRRRSVLGAALRVQRSLEGWLDRQHPRGSGSTKPTGRVLSFEETVARFPMVSRKKLQGSALWFDALLQEPQRLQVELLRWAVACGARVLNYVECDQLLTDGNRVIGVSAHCRETGERFRFATDAVVNSAGCRALGAIGAGARTETALAFTDQAVIINNK